METGAARRVCTCVSADAKLWLWIWKVLSKAPVSSFRSKHNLFLYMHQARSFSVVPKRAWRNEKKLCPPAWEVRVTKGFIKTI